VNQLDVLIADLQRMSDELDEAQTAMKVYTDHSGTTQKALNEEIGTLQAKITKLEHDRDAAYSKWIGLTISACVVPAVIAIVGIAIMVVLAVPTDGASFAMGSAVTGAATGIAAAGLGIAAGIARASYDDLVQKVSTTSELTQKRVAYRHDLGALDSTMKFSLPASNGVIAQVQLVRDAWASSLREIKHTVGDLDVSNLASGPWLRESVMAESAANWTKVDDAMRAFGCGSFIDPSLLSFGDALPKDDHDWQAKLSAQVAA
jgi:hypothetical protein